MANDRFTRRGWNPCCETKTKEHCHARNFHHELESSIGRLGDLLILVRIELADDELDRLRDGLYRRLYSGTWEYGVGSAVEMALAPHQLPAR